MLSLIRNCTVGSSLQTNGEDCETICDEEREEGGEMGGSWEAEVGVRGKAAPIRGRGRLTIVSGNEVEARSFIHDKCQEMGEADRQVGGGADHLQLHGHPGHDHQSAKPHQEGLTTEEVCIEGLQIEGHHHHDGPQIEEARL